MRPSQFCQFCKFCLKKNTNAQTLKHFLTGRPVVGPYRLKHPNTQTLLILSKTNPQQPADSGWQLAVGRWCGTQDVARPPRPCSKGEGALATSLWRPSCQLTSSNTVPIGRICVFHPGGLRLETTGTTGKNNERAPKESCFKQLFPIIKKLCGELRRCAPRGVSRAGACRSGRSRARCLSCL